LHPIYEWCDRRSPTRACGDLQDSSLHNWLCPSDQPESRWDPRWLYAKCRPENITGFAQDYFRATCSVRESMQRTAWLDQPTARQCKGQVFLFSTTTFKRSNKFLFFNCNARQHNFYCLPEGWMPSLHASIKVIVQQKRHINQKKQIIPTYL